MKLLIKIKKSLWTRRSALIIGVALSLFAIINSALYLAYQNRTYPNTVFGGKNIGAVGIDQLENQKDILPAALELSYGDSIVTKPVDEMGISLDGSALINQAQKSKHWLPVVNIVTARRITVTVTVDQIKYDAAFKSLASMYQKSPENAKLVIENNIFVIREAVNGQNLDAEKTKQAIKKSLQEGSPRVSLPVEEQVAEVQSSSLKEPLNTLQSQQSTSVTLVYQGKPKKVNQQEIIAWFVPEGTTYVLSDEKVRGFVQSVGTSYGIRVQNISEVTAAIKSSVSASKTLETVLVAAPVARKTYNYCLGARGVDSSYLNGLNTKLISVYSDPRGWGLDGLVNLNRADSGCSMTVWLSAASQMSTFGAICDSDWSCRVGANVVINFDRWQGASAAWNAAGGSLDDYRSMVINHETGHWFGFYHSDCGGAGQPAPVMQQQSISLQGCTFNPWPTTSEKQKLKTQLGL